MDTLNGYIDVIIDGLHKKNEVLDEIIIMNGKQKEILSAEEFDMDLLEGNLEKKAELVEKLNHLDDGFTSVYDRIKEELPKHKEECADRIAVMKELISQITDKTVKIQSDEARNKAIAEQFFSKSKREAGNARRSSTMANNYYKSMRQIDSSPQFFDRQK